MAGGEDLAGHRLVQHPLQRGVAAFAQGARDAGPVQVHVDRHRGCRGAVGEPRLLFAHLGHRQARAAEVARHQHVQVAGGAERLEVFGEKSILAIVDGGAFAAGLDQCIAQHRSLALQVLSCWPPVCRRLRHATIHRSEDWGLKALSRYSNSWTSKMSSGCTPFDSW